MAISTERVLGPWPDVVTVRLFLRVLTRPPFPEDGRAAIEQVKYSVNPKQLSAWLIEHGLGPLAYDKSKAVWPELAEYLKLDAIKATAENSLHLARLRQISAVFAAAGIPMVLLKGAALAAAAYSDFTLRTMSDIDIWLRPEDMQSAFQLLSDLGYVAVASAVRPPVLQKLSRGEIQFGDDMNGLVELHWSPLAGWLLKSTAVIDVDAMWSRAQSLKMKYPSQVSAADLPLVEITNSQYEEDNESGVGKKRGQIYQLSAEDTVLQLAVHTIVNHRFRLFPIRSLVDIALSTRAWPPDPKIVVERARRWRVATAVWCVMEMLQTLIGVPELEDVCTQLKPLKIRRWLIRRFVSPERLLAGDKLLGDPMISSRIGYLFLLLLVDRPFDIIRLVRHALWPDEDWLKARYQVGGSRWLHLGNVIRHGRL